MTSAHQSFFKITNPELWQRVTREVMCSWHQWAGLGCFFSSSLWTSDTRSRVHRKTNTGSPDTWCPTDATQWHQVSNKTRACQKGNNREAASLSQRLAFYMTQQGLQGNWQQHRMEGLLWCHSAPAWRPSWTWWLEGCNQRPAGGDRDTGHISWQLYRRNRGSTRKQNNLNQEEKDTKY